jgi:4-amino-4-deoxy-L-arabinose transferase-like glycosyltransferase
MATRSTEQSVVPKSGERPGHLRASIKSVARNARRWQEEIRARASSEDRVLACAAIVLAVLAAFGLRAFRLGVSYEISQDEIDYLLVSHGVLQTLWPVGRLGPFYLHPPGFFFMEAAYIKLFNINGDLISQIYGVRYLNAAIGALSAGALLWLGRRLAGWPAGIAAAAIFALEPFCIKITSRNFLEGPTVLWVLLGYGVLFSALARGEEHRSVSHRSVSWRRAVAAGVLFGLALLTKEASVSVTLLPLGICFALGWALPRIRSALVGLVALLVYAPYPAITYAIGDLGIFLDQKSVGVSRVMGLIPDFTGYNQQGGPSFLGAVVSKLDEFATTYVLLATGALAVGVLLLTDLGRTPARRLMVSWTSSAYAFLGYSIFFGTLEEHYFYYVVVSSILTTTVTTAIVLRRMRAGDSIWWARARQRGRLVLEAGAVFSVTLALWSASVWVMVHTVPDNGYQRVMSYVEDLPEGSSVAVTSTTGELLMEDAVGRTSYDRVYRSVTTLRAANIDYVIINVELVKEGWKEPPPETYRWVRDHGQLVYGFKGGRGTEEIIGVWRLQDRTEGDTPAPDLGGEGGGVSPWVGPAFLVLIATNVGVYFVLRRMQRQLLENEKVHLRLWWPDRQ